MTEMIEEIREQFTSDEAKLNGSSSAKLLETRKKAFEVFEKQGLPTKRNEEYKFTDLTRVYKKFSGITPNESTDVIPERVGIDGIEANILVTVNGIFRDDLSDIKDPKLVVLPLTDALQSNEIAQQHYGKYADSEQDPLLALNTAFSRSGIFIHLPKNIQLQFPVIIHHFTDADSRCLSYSRNLVIAEGGVKGSFIEKYDSTGDQEFLVNTVSEIAVSSNDNLTWFKIQNDSENSHLVDQLYVHQEKDSTFSATTLTLGGDTVRNNVYLSLDGENCESHLYGLYAIDGKSHVDNHTAVDHLKPHSFSNELYKGILDDKAGGVFNGKVYVRQDAQKTNAFQSNKNILLSDTAAVNTKPQLEIWADDVSCSHGCTTGQIDKEALFYLQTRGLSEKAARALLLYAFALETIEHVDHEALKAHLESLISKKLDYTAE